MPGEDAARVGDRCSHVAGGTSLTLVGPGSTTTKIDNKLVWRVGDMHFCSGVQSTPAAIPHSPSPAGAGMVMKGSFTVLIEGRPAVRKGDMVIEPAAVPPTDCSFNRIAEGCSTVKIGDLGFGLMSPDNLKAFCAEWTRLMREWDGLDEAERKRRLKGVMDNALTRAGVPPLRSVKEEAMEEGTGGKYDSTEHEVIVPDGIYGKPLTGSIGQTMLHEIRHAEQYHNVARSLAGRQAPPGATSASIASRIQATTGIHPDLVQSATGPGKAAPPLSPVGQHGNACKLSMFGEGGAHSNAKTTRWLQTPYGHPEANERYMEYASVTHEADAFEIMEALKAVCPGVR